MLKGSHETIINTLGLIITLRSRLSLVREVLELDLRVVKLSVGVTDFFTTDEELKALSESRVVAMELGERRHDARVVAEEGRGDIGIFHELAHQTVQKACRRMWWGKLELELGIELGELLVYIRVFEVDLDCLACFLGEDFLEARLHRDPLERWREINGGGWTLWALILVLKNVRAGECLDHAGNELLGEVHEVMVVGIGPVELT